MALVEPYVLPSAVVEESELVPVPDAVIKVHVSDDGWRYHPKHVQMFAEI